MERNRPAMAAIPWSQLEGAWFGCSFTNGMAEVIPAPLSKLNKVVKLLCLDALLEAEAQHPAAAVESLDRALQVARTLRNELPINIMSKWVAVDRVCLTFERLLSQTAVADPDLVSLSSRLRETDPGTFRDILVHIRCLSLWYADELRSKAERLTKGVYLPPNWLLKSYQARLLYHESDLLELLERDRQMFRVLGLPLSNAIPLLIRMDDTSPKARRPSYLDGFRRHRTSLLSLSWPTISGRFVHELNARARIQVTRSAMAIERWRLAHSDQLPASLAELVPSYLPGIPTDPFDEQPIHYRKLAKGYVVYSVGPDFIDDGGGEKPFGSGETDHCDITFTVER
jgi:hypothetical protein